MNQKALLLLSISFFAAGLFASPGHPTIQPSNHPAIPPGYNIRVKIKNYNEPKLTLGYHYGDKQYVKDTAAVGPDGYFTFKADTLMEGGIYLFIMMPRNAYIQCLVSQNEQNFTIETDTTDFYKHMKVKGSPDNQLFVDYMNFLAAQRPEADTLRARIGRSTDEKEKKKMEEKLDKIDADVEKYQEDLMAKNPKTLTAAIIKSSREVKIPEFTGPEDSIKIKRFYWYKSHYFDNLDLTDPRLLRTNLMFSKVNNYIAKLTSPHPDSICRAIEYITDRMRPAEETFKFYLIHFLNEYAKSQIVGYDAVYVWLAEKYYATGQTPWVPKEQLNKIVQNAYELKPILLGKVAPEIVVQRQDGSPVKLHGIEADYTVLFFYAHDCGHCKKQAPDLIEFYKKYKDKVKLKIFTLCTETDPEKLPKCWESMKEKGFDEFSDFINTVDPQMRSRYKSIYQVKTTPGVFLLDNKKEILSKRIEAKQLGEVLEQMMEVEKRRKEKGKTE